MTIFVLGALAVLDFDCIRYARPICITLGVCRVLCCRRVETSVSMVRSLARTHRRSVWRSAMRPRTTAVHRQMQPVRRQKAQWQMRPIRHRCSFRTLSCNIPNSTIRRCPLISRPPFSEHFAVHMQSSGSIRVNFFQNRRALLICLFLVHCIITTVVCLKSYLKRKITKRLVSSLNFSCFSQIS